MGVIILRVYGLIPITVTILNCPKCMMNLNHYLSRPVFFEIYKHHNMYDYIILAYTPDENFCSRFNRNVRRKLPKDIVSVFCKSSPEGSYFIIIKAKCKFLETVEKFNVTLLAPNVIDNGKLIFHMLIEKNRLKEFAHTLMRIYGKNNIHIEKLKTIDIVVRVYLSIGDLEKCLRTLTEREIKTLRYALKSGYFDIPRKITLNRLSIELGLSKATVETHLRKALKKILENISNKTIFACPILLSLYLLCYN